MKLCAVGQALQPLLKGLDLGGFYFSNFKRLDIDGIPAWLTRTGCLPHVTSSPMSADVKELSWPHQH